LTSLGAKQSTILRRREFPGSNHGILVFYETIKTGDSNQRNGVLLSALGPETDISVTSEQFSLFCATAVRAEAVRGIIAETAHLSTHAAADTLNRCGIRTASSKQ
jgi:hypothetical protein